MTTKNEQRAMDTERALKQASFKKEGVDWFTAVGDLLADLRHVADHRNFDFDAAVEHSILHYDIELREDNYQV